MGIGECAAALRTSISLLTGRGRSIHLVGGGVEADESGDVAIFANPFGSRRVAIHEIAVTEAGHSVIYLSVPEATDQL